MTVTGTNDPPTAANGSGATNEDTVLAASLPSGSDPDADPLTFALSAGAAHGVVAVSANGGFSYTPAANFNGADSFGFTVSDGKGGAASYTYNLTVNPVNFTYGTVLNNIQLSGTATAFASRFASRCNWAQVCVEWRPSSCSQRIATAVGWLRTQRLQHTSARLKCVGTCQRKPACSAAYWSTGGFIYRSQPAPGRPKAAERPLGGQERSDVGALIKRWRGAAECA